MSSFRLQPETRIALEAVGLQAVAHQPPWLRPRGRTGAPRATRTEQDGWEVALYPEGKGGLSSASIAWGFGETPDEAVERALRDPRCRIRMSRLSELMFELERHLFHLRLSVSQRVQRLNGWGDPTRWDDLDDDIPF